MDFENLSAKKPQGKKALDDKWFETFKNIASFADYEYLNGDKDFRDKQKKSFVCGEIENPTLDYPALKNFDFKGREDGLLALKKDIFDRFLKF